MSLHIQLTHRLPQITLDLSFDAPAGITVLFGPSGAGKSTIANAVAGLLTPDSGRILLRDRLLFDSAAGINTPPHRRRIGYVFQEARLFPHLTLRQNLRFGQWFNPAARNAPFDRIVDLLGLGALLQRRPATLSGGEKSRAALGRALLAGPQLLVMDEPLAALDQARKDEILPYLERLRDEIRQPILYITHDRAEVQRLASHLVRIKAGKLVYSGPPAGMEPPRDLRLPARITRIDPAEAGGLHVTLNLQGQVLTRVLSAQQAAELCPIVGQNLLVDLKASALCREEG